MGRYVIVLAIPIVIGVLIAAAVIIIGGLRQQRNVARLAPFDTQRPDGESLLADSPDKDKAAATTHGRIAS
jgi:hypothetical protein